MQNLKINSARLWESLMEMAKIGATPKGGVARLAGTELDGQGRDLFVKWAEDAGCTVTVDKVGNIFARRPGSDRRAAGDVGQPFGHPADRRPFRWHLRRVGALEWCAR